MWIARAGAMLDKGRRKKSRGDIAGAAKALQRAADSGDRRHNVIGALHLWILRSETGDLRAADNAYLRAVELVGTTADEKSVADRSLRVGCDIAAYWPEILQPARLAYRRRIDSGDREGAPVAAIGLAGLELQQAQEVYGTPDPGSVISALRFVIDSGHPDHVPVAAGWLAFVSELTGDVDAARTALRAALDVADTEKACGAALNAAKVFKRKGHPDEAITALRFVFDNSTTGRTVIAAESLGELLAARGDVEGARAAYRYVLDNSTFPHVIRTVRAALDQL